MANCKCSKCRGDEEFDARAAYEKLYLKFEELTDIVTRYMSEAKMKRPMRTKNASEMAERLAAVVGGDPTTEFPECAAVKGVDPCTGVLVHPQIVLTAGHCEGTSSVLLDCTARNDQAGEEIEVLINRRHRNYNAVTHFFDIRVLILKKPATRATPVTIATAQEIRNAQSTILVGFGDSEFGTGRKRQGRTSIDHNPTGVFGLDNFREFVARGGGVDTCFGDSGGPAYILVGGSRKVAGLTSRGSGDNCGDGGIYTRIDAHLNFIGEVANGAGIDFSI